MRNAAWTIRLSAIDDARAIAEVHTESYNSAYRGIFPDSLFDGMSVEKRECSWRENLAAPVSPLAFTLVGCGQNGRVEGFASGGHERTGQLGFAGEMYAIYLRPEAQRRGLGALLFKRFVLELASRGLTSMAVWVLELNPSRRFYERLGGRVIAQQPIERGGQTFIEVAYGWPDLQSRQG